MGVFIGCMWLEYGELLAAHGAGAGAFVVTGNGLAFLAGRVSYAFGFTGPCVPTNTGALTCILLPHGQFVENFPISRKRTNSPRPSACFASSCVPLYCLTDV
jgi:hypothetical protein